MYPITTIAAIDEPSLPQLSDVVGNLKAQKFGIGVGLVLGLVAGALVWRKRR